ncbi:MAG: amino acid adenylation domain-containing protein, partial [Anaerolineaceae bacterium]|nr:amino acid adenylation domain-containing protein [Anaerolineaceae bacterium]
MDNQSERSQRLKTLSPLQKRLLERRLKGKKGVSAERTIRHEDRQISPLSYSQEQIWLTDQQITSPDVYSRPMALHLTGELDIVALKWSLIEIIRRHDILRTSFPVIKGAPHQKIHPLASIKFEIIDLSEVSSQEQDERVKELIFERKNSFNLTAQPPFNITLIKISLEEHVLLFAMHHIIFDAWSSGILLKEFSIFYDHAVSGKGELPASLPIQYADYAQWQRQQNEIFNPDRVYWKRQLGGELPVLELPADRIHPAVRSYYGSSLNFKIEPSVVESLKALCLQEDTTLYMCLLAIFYVLLFRYADQTDIIVGTPVSGRDLPDTEKLIGIFINTLALRSDLSGNPTFRDYLGRLRKVCLEAFSHQRLPFEELIKELTPMRDPSRNVLFQVMFQLRNTPRDAVQSQSLGIEEMNIRGNSAKFDLTLDITETAYGLDCIFEYNRDIFDAATIKRMMGHYRTLMTGVISNPDAYITKLPILDDAERQQILVDWNATQADFSHNKCVHELFEAQADRTPDSTAVVDGDLQITFRELNIRANQLAHHLRGIGVGPEKLVGIYLDRSIDMIVGILGTLKAGGAFLPIDPAYPEKRRHIMLEETMPEAILAHQCFQQQPPQYHAKIILMDMDWETISYESETKPETNVRSNDLCYVTYTSGSTGKPKGIAVEHRSAANIIQWYQHEFMISSSDRASQITSLSFDASFREIWGNLIAGACLYIGDYKLRASPKDFWQWICDNEITVAYLPTPLAEQALKEQLPSDLSLRILSVSGDKLNSTPTQPLPFRLVNLYGPAEGTTNSTSGTVEPKSHSKSRPHIGRPIDNVKLYILDRYLNPVPIGIPGELHIAGAGLARGYYNQPELTKKSFIPNPFAGGPGERIYRTGDICRYRVDGNIDFLGRRDNQVKLRAIRIELSEIEIALSQMRGVSEALVRVVERQPEDRHIIGYIVPEKNQRLTSKDLKIKLGELLPEYMIPTVFMFVDTLPLTISGKYDRKALPSPDWNNLDLESSYKPPGTALEKELVSIWSEVLGIDRIGVFDNFFDLGGHSLLVISLCVHIEMRFNKPVSFSEIFQAPTIAQQASLLKNIDVHPDEFQAALHPSRKISSQSSSISAAAAPVNLVSSEIEQADFMIDEMAPLSFSQEGLWFLQKLNPESTAYNIHNAIQFSGKLDIAVLEKVLHEIIRRHEVLRTSFPVENGKIFQKVHNPGDFSLSHMDLSEYPPDDTERQLQKINALALRSFNLSDQIPLSCTLAKLEEQKHILSIVLHHIIFDGLSRDILLREIAAFYAQYTSGSPSSHADLAIQYLDFSIWQRGWLGGEKYNKLIQYWKRALQDYPPTLELPRDHAHSKSQPGKVKTKILKLPYVLFNALRSLSQQENATLFMILLAAYNILLSRYSGHDDIIVGSPITKRGSPETKELIGLFINTLALRTDLSGNPNFSELLARVKTACLGAFDHRDMPFDRLIEELAPDRSLIQTSLFQVMFQLRNKPLETIEVQDLEIKNITIEFDDAKFDLILDIIERTDELECRFKYNQALFSASTIADVAERFQILLENIVESPEKPIGGLSLLSASDELRILTEWNDTKSEFPNDQSVQSIFEIQVQKTPDATALIYDESEMTYKALNESANQLAHYLRKKGVSRGHTVGLCMDNTSEMIIGLLGILKAGGTYLPLDPTYPQTRLAFMIEDAKATILLAHRQYKNLFPQNAVEIICLDTGWKQISGEDSGNLKNQNQVNDPAYAIYTSGSMGIPKGVIIPHKAITRLVIETNYIQIKESDVIAQVSNISFDAAIFEIWGALLNGCKLVLIPRSTLLTPRDFSSQLASKRISILFLTTALFNFLVTKAPGAFSSLRCLLFGGEEVDPEKVRSILQYSPPETLLHVYGPTENTTFSIWYHVKNVSPNDITVPIGKPVSNTEAYILDNDMKPVPPGAPGELYLGGDGLALSYLNSPELTTEKFLPDPFSNDPHARLYKTGDTCRFLPDGTIIFMGRKDEQVKIRGFRIELGEVTSTIRQHPSILNAVVLALKTETNDKRIAAYVVMNPANLVSTKSLRDYLKARLPHFMIPSALIALPSLPLTPNGKIDRAALPPPNWLNPDAAAAYNPPHTAAEKILAEIWSEILDIEQRISIDDDFFTLGGHSLLVVSLCIHIEDRLKKSISFSQVFQFPTIRQLAALITGEAIQVRGLFEKPATKK